MSTQFAWENGYGVFSLGGKQLDTAVAYMKHQKEHHFQGNTIQFLEYFDFPGRRAKIVGYIPQRLILKLPGIQTPG